MDQVKLDFTRSPIVTGKKNQRLSIPCSDELLEMVDFQANKLGTSRAELGFQFVVEGLQRNLGTILMSDHYADTKLKDLLHR